MFGHSSSCRGFWAANSKPRWRDVIGQSYGFGVVILSGHFSNTHTAMRSWYIGRISPSFTSTAQTHVFSAGVYRGESNTPLDAPHSEGKIGFSPPSSLDAPQSVTEKM